MFAVTLECFCEGSLAEVCVAATALSGQCTGGCVRGKKDWRIFRRAVPADLA
jgi:hypothetical protein